jgi:hypothetical protein
MRRLSVLQTKADVVEIHILRTVGLDQARDSIADGMDCRRSNCFLATSVEQTAGGHCETELQFVPTVMDSGVPPPRFRCRHNRKPARSRLSAADLPPPRPNASAGRRIRAFTEGVNHRGLKAQLTASFAS